MKNNNISPAQNSAMPRKAELFGHFRRVRVVFSGFYLKLPLSESAIVRSFGRSPENAEKRYAEMKADTETLTAISAGIEAYMEKMAEDPQKRLEGLERRHLSILETCHKQKLTHVAQQQLDLYIEALKRFEQEIENVNAIVSETSQGKLDAKKEDAIAFAVGRLRQELADARKRNRAEVLAD